MGGGTQQTWISVRESAHGKGKERGWQDLKLQWQKEEKDASENMSLKGIARNYKKLQLGIQQCFIKKIQGITPIIDFF